MWGQFLFCSLYKNWVNKYNPVGAIFVLQFLIDSGSQVAACPDAPLSNFASRSQMVQWSIKKRAWEHIITTIMMDIVLIISACHLEVVKEKQGEAKGRSVWSPRLSGSWVRFEGTSNNK